MKIKSRITLFIVCVGFFSILIVSLVLLREMLEQPLRVLDDILREDARRTVFVLARERGDGSGNVYTENDLSYNNLLWIEVYGDVSRQDLIYRSPLAKMLPMDPVPPGKKAVLRVPAAPEQENGEKKLIFRVINYEAEQDGRAYWVQIARPMGKLYEEFIESIIWAALGLAISVLVSFALAREASKRIIRPIGEIERLARKISDKNLQERIPVGEENDELSVLADTLNLMLDRLQNSFSLQKEFLYDTSHELKTPLTTMRLAVESLRSRQTGKDKADEETILCLESQIWRMDRLVRDLLHLSAMEARNDINESSVNLGEMISELIDDYRIMAEGKDIDMTLKLPGNEIIFSGDREKLRRAFSNVLDNAIKYGIGGGYIHIEAAKTSEGFVITVENSGAEVDAEEAERIFDRFYRGEKSRSFSEDGGFGLGLAIVKKSVEIHKGKVRFESNAGINRLTIFLPGMRC